MNTETTQVPETQNVTVGMDLTSLKELERKQNNGRGVVCVRGIITCLERDDMKDAKIWADWDHDKIRNYPEIKSELIKLGVIE